MEIKSGEGGEESALFAGLAQDVFALRREPRLEDRDSRCPETDLGGYKSVTVAIKAPAAEAGLDALRGAQVRRWCASGATGAGDRVAGSAAYLRRRWWSCPRSPKPRLRSMRTISGSTSTARPAPAVRASTPLTRPCASPHLPSGIVVSCQNERSQLQNREQAMRMLRARLTAAAEEEAATAASAARRSQVRTVDRSERIRTYNFPENRISDHRIGFKSYNLDQVLNGDLDAVIKALQEADTQLLSQVGGPNREQGCSTAAAPGCESAARGRRRLA